MALLKKQAKSEVVIRYAQNTCTTTLPTSAGYALSDGRLHPSDVNVAMLLRIVLIPLQRVSVCVCVCVFGCLYVCVCVWVCVWLQLCFCWNLRFRPVAFSQSRSYCLCVWWFGWVCVVVLVFVLEFALPPCCLLLVLIIIQDSKTHHRLQLSIFASFVIKMGSKSKSKRNEGPSGDAARQKKSKSKAGAEPEAEGEDEIIDLRGDSKGDDPALPTERALRGSRRLAYRQGHYGCNDEELYAFLRGCTFGAEVQWLDPLIITMHECKLNVRAPNHQGQLLLVCKPPRRSHWGALCFDFEHRIFGSVGAGRLHPTITDYLDAHHIMISRFQDITPAVGDQVESECGARAAIYCKWFATVRTRCSIDRRDIDVRQFHVDVADLMTAWRAAR